MKFVANSSASRKISSGVLSRKVMSSRINKYQIEENEDEEKSCGFEEKENTEEELKENNQCEGKTENLFEEKNVEEKDGIFDANDLKEQLEKINQETGKEDDYDFNS
jgi:hypothetical protein